MPSPMRVAAAAARAARASSLSSSPRAAEFALSRRFAQAAPSIADIRAPVQPTPASGSGASSSSAPSSASSSSSSGGRSAGFPPSSSYVRNREVERKAIIDEILRVDQAGEIGAVQIYAGQAWVLKGTRVEGKLEVRGEERRDEEGAEGRSSHFSDLCASMPTHTTTAPHTITFPFPPTHPLLFFLPAQEMKRGEQVHLDTINRLMSERRTRPTALLPLWNAAGFALGAATALMGKEAAMACTVAVETAISAHYNDQIRTLLAKGYDVSEGDLAAILKKHRDEELEHHDTAIEHGAKEAPFFNALSAVIQAGCAVAISVARRV
jgi:demethoxyubiquinone hydroxylase (CLK1/Coq7/Cat5 family)